jgi:hypothetical protein
LFTDNESKVVRDKLVNPYWIDHNPEMEGYVEFLDSNELEFWHDLIKKYLYVLPKDPKVSVIISATHFPNIKYTDI